MPCATYSSSRLRQAGSSIVAIVGKRGWRRGPVAVPVHIVSPHAMLLLLDDAVLEPVRAGAESSAARSSRAGAEAQ